MSAREKYRRPSLFAILLGMTFAFTGWITRTILRVPRWVFSRLAIPKPSLSPLLARVKIPREKAAQAVLTRLKVLWERWLFFRRPLYLRRDWTTSLTVPRIHIPKDAVRKSFSGPALARRGRGLASVVWASMIVRPWLILVVPGVLRIAALVPKAAAVQMPPEWVEKMLPGPVYRVNARTVPDTLDPQLAIFAPETGHLRLIYEGLTRQDAMLRTVPAAASDWTYAYDGMQIVFTLREGLTYSDGSPLNAKRFEYALLRAVDPQVRAEKGSLLDGVVGAYSYRTADPTVTPAAVLDELRAQVQIKARSLDGALCSGYEQTDCRELHITLIRPDYGFHARMSSWISYPAKEELLGAGEDWRVDEGMHIGNGPFMLNRIDFAGHTDFAPNPHYWGAQPAYSLEFIYQTDEAAALAAYRAGDLDILPVSDPALIQEILDDSELAARLRRQTAACTYAIRMDESMPPFEDAKVRAAFALAIDRQSFVNELYNGRGRPTLTWIAPQMPGYRPGEARWGFSPEKARQMLAESSYGGAEGLPPVTVEFIDNPHSNAFWQGMRKSWLDVLGVEVILKPMPPAPYYVSPLQSSMWCQEVADPSASLEVWKTGSAAASRTHFSDAAYDALLEQAAAEPDANQRLALYRQAQDHLIEKAPLIMLLNPTSSYLFRFDLLPHGTPFDAIFPVDVDPAAFTAVESRLYMPLIGQ